MIQNYLALLGNTYELDFPDYPTVNLEMFIKIVTSAFGLKNKVENLMLESEMEFIINNHQEWGDDVKPYLAYLVQGGIFPAVDYLGGPKRILTRGEAVYFIWKIMQTYRDFVREGMFKTSDQDKLYLTHEDKEVQLAYNSSVFLLRNHGGEYSFAKELHLLGGEKLRWVANEDKISLLEVVYPPYSNILDRASKLHTWNIRHSREDLTQRINQYYPISELLDLVPQKRGKSKRVVELLIKGLETSFLVKGLRIRRVLGLRETLFVIDKEYDDKGLVTDFVFKGKGWGHGVGLCQVGAYGMAQTGAGYKDILKKYYTGIKIGTIY